MSAIRKMRKSQTPEIFRRRRSAVRSVAPRSTGVWISHGQAQLVQLRGAAPAEFMRIQADEVESTHRSFGQGGVGPAPRHVGGNVESRYARRRDQELRRYYDGVISALRPTDQVLILGPGEAKTEFVKRLQIRRPALARKVVAVESADRLTRGEFTGRVRESAGGTNNRTRPRSERGRVRGLSPVVR